MMYNWSLKELPPAPGRHSFCTRLLGTWPETVIIRSFGIEKNGVSTKRAICIPPFPTKPKKSWEQTSSRSASVASGGSPCLCNIGRFSGKSKGVFGVILSQDISASNGRLKNQRYNVFDLFAEFSRHIFVLTGAITC